MDFIGFLAVAGVTAFVSYLISYFKSSPAATHSATASEPALRKPFADADSEDVCEATAEAQAPTALTVGERVQQVLRQQGIAFQVDDDGKTIWFEWHFMRYALRDADSKDYFQLDLAFGNPFDINDEDAVYRLLRVTNSMNVRFRIGKMLVFNDALLFSIQVFVTPTTDMNYLLNQSCHLLDAMQCDYNEPDDEPDDDTDTGEASGPSAEVAAPVAVDAILEKVKAVGYDQLTDEEKAALLDASGHA